MASPTEKKKPDIRIGHLSTAYHTALVMMGRNSLEQRGLCPSWELFGTGPPIVKALETGKLDIGYIGLPPAIIGIARGARIRCVAGGHENGTVLIARPEFLSAAEAGSMSAMLKQFEGRTIGSPSRGSIHDVILRHILEAEGMSSKVTVKNYAWTDFVAQAIEDGAIDSAVGTPSLQVALNLVAGVDVKPMAPPDKLWPHNPSYGIIASENFIRQWPDILLEFLIAHKETIDFIKTEPAEAGRISARVTGVAPPEFFVECYKVSPHYCSALPEDYIASTMRFIHPLLDQGYITRPVTRKEIFDTSFVKKTHPLRYPPCAGMSPRT